LLTLLPRSPPLPPPAEAEFPNGEEITEAADPTREEEEEFEALQNANEGGEESQGEEPED